MGFLSFLDDFKRSLIWASGYSKSPLTSGVFGRGKHSGGAADTDSSSSKSYAEIWTENFWRNFNETNAAVLNSYVGRGVPGGYSMLFSAPQVVERVQGLSLLQGIKAFLFGVPENLP